MFHSAALLRMAGRDGLMLLALAAYAGRTCGYTALTPSTAWLLLPIEARHAVALRPRL